jgi:hypothetical protein
MRELNPMRELGALELEQVSGGGGKGKGGGTCTTGDNGGGLSCDASGTSLVTQPPSYFGTYHAAKPGVLRSTF